VAPDRADARLPSAAPSISHAKQPGKGTKIPYIAHLLGVASIALSA
jgi:hypothetical protein